MSTTSPRRISLRTVAMVVALAAALLTACGTTPTGPAPTGTPSARSAQASPAVTAPRLVMIIRHGEKPDGSEAGVDADGNEDSSSLTATGWDRAHRLVDLFDPAQGAPRAGTRSAQEPAPGLSTSST